MIGIKYDRNSFKRGIYSSLVYIDWLNCIGTKYFCGGDAKVNDQKGEGGRGGGHFSNWQFGHSFGFRI